MNFDHANKVSDYFRENIWPHMTNHFPALDFSNYLSKLAELSACKWMQTEMKAFPVNYFMDPHKFVKKYEKNCVTFLGTTDARDGSMQIIYQISPTFHVLARLFHWMEQEEVKSYLMLTVAFRDMKEFSEFFDENKDLRLTGNTEDRVTGFGGLMNKGDVGFASRMIKRVEEDNEEY